MSFTFIKGKKELFFEALDAYDSSSLGKLLKTYIHAEGGTFVSYPMTL